MMSLLADTEKFVITPDELSTIPLFSDLTTDQLGFLARSVEDIWLLPGEFAAHEDDDRAFFVVVEGRIELTKIINGVERVIGPRLPGEVIGEVPMLLSTNLPASVKAAGATRILKPDVKTFFGLATMAPQVFATVGALAKGRIEGLKEITAETAKPDMTVIGPLIDPRVHHVRRFLNRNNITFETINTRDSTGSARPDGGESFPVVELADGRRLIAPTVREIAVAGGLEVLPPATISTWSS